MMIFEHFRIALLHVTIFIVAVSWSTIWLAYSQTPAGVQNGTVNKGVKLSAAESTTVANTLTKLKNQTDSITITKTGQKFATADIEKDLKKALKDGRIGKETGSSTDKATTHSDDNPSANGDEMNLNASQFTTSNQDLANTLSHEWRHMKDDGKSSYPQFEVNGYQLGMATYLVKGGNATDDSYTDDSQIMEGYKDSVKRSQTTPNSNTPKTGKRAGCSIISPSTYYFLDQDSGIFEMQSSTTRLDSMHVLPGATWFFFKVLPPVGGNDLIIISGADTTIPGFPRAIFRFISSNGSQFVSHRDTMLQAIRHPFCMTYDDSLHDLYVLDTYTNGFGIAVIKDKNSDGIPDSLRPVPFAPWVFPNVDSGRSIMFTTHPTFGRGLYLSKNDERGMDMVDGREQGFFIFDQNNDGNADNVQPARKGELYSFAPAFVDEPYLMGTDSVTIVGIYHHAIAIISTDSTGTQNNGSLGFATVGGVDPIRLGLSRPLISGEYIIPLDLTSNRKPFVPTQVLPFEIQVADGWNLLSVPLAVSDPGKAALFPTAISPAFGYNGKYVVYDSLSNGFGYWLKFTGAQSITLSGTPIVSDSFPVNVGWNMIGSISSSVAVNTITSNPPAIVTSQFFSYNGGYQIASTIDPGLGYWVKVSQSGMLLVSHSAANPSSRISIVPTSERPPSPPYETAHAGAIPSAYALSQNYPNPFNPSTEVRVEVPVSSFVSLKVFDVLGREVATLVNERKTPGTYHINWDATSVPSGIYFYKLSAGTFSDTKKMVILK